MHPGRVDVIGAGALVLRDARRAVGVRRGAGQRARHPRRHRVQPVRGRERARARPGSVRCRSPPGSGRPNDLASRSTPVARTPEDVVRLAASAPTLAHLDGRSPSAAACPRLVAWREEVARGQAGRVPRRAVLGPAGLRLGRCAGRGILVVGLAPAAHGGNRTGRIFTGDRSGDWLYAALHRAGLAGQPTSTHADDGQQLLHTRLDPRRAVRPAGEQADHGGARDLLALAGRRAAPRAADACARWSCSAGSAGRALWPGAGRAGVAGAAPAAGLRARRRGRAAGGPVLLGCYHVSQQNTFTGRLTEPMLDAVFARAKELAGLSLRPVGPGRPASDGGPEVDRPRSLTTLSGDPVVACRPGLPRLPQIQALLGRDRSPTVRDERQQQRPGPARRGPGYELQERGRRDAAGCAGVHAAATADDSGRCEHARRHLALAASRSSGQVGSREVRHARRHLALAASSHRVRQGRGRCGMRGVIWH